MDRNGGCDKSEVKAKHWFENPPNRPPTISSITTTAGESRKIKRKGSSVLWDSESIWRVPQTGKTHAIQYHTGLSTSQSGAWAARGTYEAAAAAAAAWTALHTCPQKSSQPCCKSQKVQTVGLVTAAASSDHREEDSSQRVTGTNTHTAPFTPDNTCKTHSFSYLLWLARGKLWIIGLMVVWYVSQYKGYSPIYCDTLQF